MRAGFMRFGSAFAVYATVMLVSLLNLSAQAQAQAQAQTQTQTQAQAHAAPAIQHNAHRETIQPLLPVEVPGWAFPVAAPAPPSRIDSVNKLHIPNSAVAFTDAELHNRYNVPDWFPASHSAMPRIVAHGREPAIIACGFCHLPDGSGRPENAMLAGLPAGYIREQLADLKSRGRQSAYHGKFGPIDLMRSIADSLTKSEIADAARYFSNVQPHQRSKIIEATTVPHTTRQTGLYFRDAAGGEEPLGQRIIEMAVEANQHELRNAHAEYVAYVPPGSIARGRQLANNGKTACSVCHGAGLRGVGMVPPLAGRSPSYLVRQLVAFRNGDRFTVAGRPMRAVVASLSPEDMIAAAAYAGSIKP